MRRVLRGVLNRVNALAETSSREHKENWDIYVQRLRSARDRTKEPTPMSDERLRERWRRVLELRRSGAKGW